MRLGGEEEEEMRRKRRRKLGILKEICELCGVEGRKKWRGFEGERELLSEGGEDECFGFLSCVLRVLSGSGVDGYLNSNLLD